MSLILAIDTSATPVSCALLKDDRVLASYYSHTGMTHSQTLMPMIDSVLNNTGISIEQLDAIAVNAGPGSFTGVRIGVATVKGLAFTNDTSCISVSTLESMAASFAGLPGDCLLVCVMDARCNQVYTATFEQQESDLPRRMTADEAMSIQELTARLSAQQRPIILVGDGADLCYKMMLDKLPDIQIAPVALRYQNAVGTALVAARMLAAEETVSADDLLPVYLRLPQAERELRARQMQEK